MNITIFKRDKRTVTEKESDRVVEIMSMYDPACEEYKAMAENLEKLTEAKKVSFQRKINPDTILTLAVQLGIVGITAWVSKTDIMPKYLRDWFPKGRV